MNSKLIIIFIYFFHILQYALTSPPVAIFHGFADSCNSEQGLARKIKETLNTHAECIEIGNGHSTSIYTNLLLQSEEACLKINENEHFQGDFSIIGISQGNLISRYLIEKCNLKGKVVRYLSLHGPHQGLGYIPKTDCGRRICDVFNTLASYSFYKIYPVDLFAPTSYMKFRYNQQDYKKVNKFLTDLNNEGEFKSEENKKRFSSLEKLMLVKSPYDATIRPPESSWFEFYDENGDNIIPLENSKFYIEDYIGLRKLDEEGKVQFVEFKERHVEYTDEELEKYILPFLK